MGDVGYIEDLSPRSLTVRGQARTSAAPHRIGGPVAAASVSGMPGRRSGLPSAGAESERQSVWVGEVTWREVADLREALFDELEVPGYVGLRLDVRRVTLIDRPGSALLIGANHRAVAIGRRLVLVDANGPVTVALSKLHVLKDFLVAQVFSAYSPSEGTRTSW